MRHIKARAGPPPHPGPMLAPVPDPPIVFVVDDDDAVRRALAFTLDLEGFRVETFESGEALLLTAPDAAVDCLVIDERLPGASGLETLRLFRDRRAGVPAILITSHPKAAFRAAAAEAAVPILEKPLTGDLLAPAIRDAIAARAT
ncbi:response regulator [Phenylobacterium sp. SCN 70-31]|uniref:response regulator n=1 Tax=Phenylobacterium sp. SCN 70-31 TaxID=1660129 RepID=UPI0025F330E6|nr:response regulator [Phenylobacterium sp. SCN 70-31]